MSDSKKAALTSSLSTYLADLDDDFTDLGAARALAPRDVVRSASISDVAMAPDGTRVAFVRARAEHDDASGRLRTVRVICTQNTTKPFNLRQLTSGPGDGSPSWSPDGQTVAFVRGGHIFAIDVRGGEARPVARLAVDAANACFVPGAQAALAFTAGVHLDDESFAATAARVKAAGERAFRVYDELMVRSWDAYTPPTRSHLFVAPLTDAADDGVPRWQLQAPPRDVMRGVDADTPTHATFGGREQFCFSPDGSLVAFTSKARTADAAWSVSTCVHLAHIGADDDNAGADAPESADAQFVAQHTLQNPGVDTDPCFSPDGKTLAWISTNEPGNEAAKRTLSLYELGSRKVQRVALKDLDVSISEFRFTSNKRGVFTADHLGHHKLFTVDLEVDADKDGVLHAPTAQITSEGSLNQIQVCDNGGAVVGVFSKFEQPYELAKVHLADSVLELITELNSALVKEVELPRVRSFNIVGAEGKQMQMFVCVPPRAAMLHRSQKAKEEKARLPLLMLCHGGPQGAWNSGWHKRWNLELWASLGFVVCAPNFTGSTGFGQAYCDAISRAWDVAAKDVLLAADFVLEEFDFVDPAQQFVMGASFGGWLTMFLAGYAPERFRALVAHDGVFDQRTMAFHTDELFFTEHEFGLPNDPEADALMKRCSPSTLMHKWQSPILLLHGAQDFRCPLGESLGAFTAARRRGVRARLAICETANHWVLEPNASLEWHALIEDWFHEHSDRIMAWDNAKKRDDEKSE